MSEFGNLVDLKSSDVKTTSSTKHFPLGTRGMTADGRAYRYAYNGGTALTMGVPVMTAALYALDKDTEYTAPINDTEEISTTWRSFTVETETSTGEIAANEYADGFVRVATSTAATAKGQLVRIKSNDASATSSTDALGSTMTITFADDDKLTVALTTGAITTLHHSPYWGTVAAIGAGAAMAGAPVGVPNVAVAINYYYWAQTWGPCAVRQDGVAITGFSAIVSTGATSTGVQTVAKNANATGSTSALWTNTARPTIGWWMGSPGTDDYFGLIFLTINP